MVDRPRERLARRAARAPMGLAGVTLVIATLRWGVGSPRAAARTLGASAHSDFSPLLVAALGLAAWALLAWFALAVGLEAASAAPGATGRLCRWLARHVGPRFLRASARWLVGVTLLASPLVAAPAMAAAGSPPSLDRPVATATMSPQPSPSSALSPTSPTLDRPAAPYLPPPPPRPRANSPGVGIVAGAPHRDVADDAYVVRRGDSLWDVAARYLGPDATATQIAREWPRWYSANQQAIGADPNLIRPGMTLRPPGDTPLVSTPTTHP